METKVAPYGNVKDGRFQVSIAVWLGSSLRCAAQVVIGYRHFGTMYRSPSSRVKQFFLEERRPNVLVVYAYVFRGCIQIVNLLIFAHTNQIDSGEATQNSAGNLTSLKVRPFHVNLGTIAILTLQLED